LAIPLLFASSSIVAYTPSSSVFRHRNARASALTMALSTRGRGAHAAPSGVTISFRAPRFLNVIGMWTVIVSPSAKTVARVTLLPSCYQPPRGPSRRARSAAAGAQRRAFGRRSVRQAAARSAPARPGTVHPIADRAAAAPKRLLVYRAAAPFAGIRRAPIEVLGLGQQFVAHAIHPDTGRPYEWPEESLADLDINALPGVDEAPASYQTRMKRTR
jgi:hypothetical protein